MDRGAPEPPPVAEAPAPVPEPAEVADPPAEVDGEPLPLGRAVEAKLSIEKTPEELDPEEPDPDEPAALD